MFWCITAEAEARRPLVEIQNQISDKKYDFKIDWSDLYKASDTVEDRLKTGKKLKSRQKKEIVKRLVNQVRTKTPHAKRDIFRQIVRDMKNKYSSSFKSELARGKLNKRGLCHRMQTKFDNDKRPARRTRMEQQAPDIKAAYGCQKWRQVSIPQGETEDSLREAQEELAQYYETARPSAWDWDYITAAMQKTYREQRADINTQAEQLIELEKRLKKTRTRRRNQEKAKQKAPGAPEAPEDPDEPEAIQLMTTALIRDKWPFLFEPKCMMSHFNELTNKDLAQAMLTFMSQSATNIVGFLVDTNDKKEKPKRIRKHMRRAQEWLPPYNAEIVALLKLLLQRFKEKEEAIWILVHVSIF